MNRTALLLSAILSIIFLSLCLLFHDYVIDDAFIIYRLARNLAQGHGIVWNVGQEPVEGCTSFLWLLVNALGIYCGLDPVWVSKTVSVLSSLIVIWVLVRQSRGLSVTLQYLFSSAIALSPIFAFHSMQGLETSFTALLLLMAALWGYRAVLVASWLNVSGFFLFVLLSFLARPDTAPFCLGMILGMLGSGVLHRDAPLMGRMLRAGFVLFVALAGYFLWRFHYFGLPFPTSYYFKVESEKGLISGRAVIQLVLFLFIVVVPYLLVTVYLSWRRFEWRKAEKVFPLYLGCLFMAAATLAVTPFQAFPCRYLYPLYPAFLLATIFLLAYLKGNKAYGKNKMVMTALILILSVYNLLWLPMTLKLSRLKSSQERVRTGQMLAGMGGVMFVTEAGAVPYYSEWESYEHVGLCTPQVAREGLSSAFLASVNPDLILVHIAAPQYWPYGRERTVIDAYLKERRYLAVAAIQKAPGQYHYYFVRAESRLFQPLVLRLNNVPGVNYGNLEKLMSLSNIKFFKGSNFRE